MLQGRAQDGGFAGPGLPALLEFQQCRAEVRGQVEALPWAKPHFLSFSLHVGILTAPGSFGKGSNYFQKSGKLGLPAWEGIAYTEGVNHERASLAGRVPAPMACQGYPRPLRPVGRKYGGQPGETGIGAGWHSERESRSYLSTEWPIRVCNSTRPPGRAGTR